MDSGAADAHGAKGGGVGAAAAAGAADAAAAAAATAHASGSGAAAAASGERAKDPFSDLSVSESARRAELIAYFIDVATESYALQVELKRVVLFANLAHRELIECVYV